MEENMGKQKINENLKTSIDRYRRFLKGFTLIEIMIVVVIIGLIATFGIPIYGKMINKSHERNAILGLTSINQANSVYEAKKGEFLPGAGLNLTQINSGLSIDVKALDLTYSYTRATVSTYTATGAWTGGNAFTVRTNQDSISLGGNNPCCSAGSCPTLPNC